MAYTSYKCRLMMQGGACFVLPLAMCTIMTPCNVWVPCEAGGWTPPSIHRGVEGSAKAQCSP